MKWKNSIAIVYLLFIVNTLIGQVTEYQYQRSILDVKDQWHSISLPQEVLNQTNFSKSDIRIVGYDELGEEFKVPYVLKSQKEEVIIESENVNVFNESTLDSVFVYMTEESALGRVNQLELDIGNYNYDGRVKLEGKDGDDWFTILEDYRIFSFSKSNDNFEYTTLEIPESDYKSYRISISNIKDPILNKVSVVRRSVRLGSYFDVKAIFRHVKDDKQNKSSIYMIKLDSTSRISELIFDIEGDFDHYRRVMLSSIKDSVKTKNGWKKLKKSFYNGALISYENDRLLFDDQMVTTIEMIVYNLDDQPLIISSVKANTPQYELVGRFGGDSDYYLTYGNPYANAPQYDLTKFKENIPEDMVALKLGNPSIVNAKEDVPNFFIPSSALYAIMALIIAVIGWFTIKMLSSDAIGED